MSAPSTDRINAWREARNDRSRARLDKALPKTFPPVVLAHALSRPFIPPTPRRAIESYWRHHPLRAETLARSLARLSGAPNGWHWRLDVVEQGRRTSFRTPPAPYREPAYDLGPGHCCVCGQPVYRFGWHRDLWADGKQNRRASWHTACVTAWRFWCDPVGHLKLLRRAQGRICPATGKRLLRAAEVDHREPLFKVWREHRDKPWPDLLAYWGRPNLQVINQAGHRAKCAEEARERAAIRTGAYALIHSEL